jgi:hypothetical protein
MVATLVEDDVHTAELVRFWVLRSVYVPVAANCHVFPDATEGFVGVTDIDTSAAAVTVRTVDPPIVPEVAVIVVVPAPAPVANP